MAMKLTRYEREVVINLNEAEDTATIYSSNPVWLRKLDALVKEFPDMFMVIRQSNISKTYSFPKRLLSIGKPRELSSVLRGNKRLIYCNDSLSTEPENAMSFDNE